MRIASDIKKIQVGLQAEISYIDLFTRKLVKLVGTAQEIASEVRPESLDDRGVTKTLVSYALLLNLSNELRRHDSDIAIVCKRISRLAES